MCCGAGSSAEGLTGRLGQGLLGYYVASGCLFKPKSCLDYYTQTLLLCSSCMRHKGKVLEIGRRKKRGSQKGKERVIMGGGSRKNGRSGQCHPSFLGNGTNNK